MNLLNQITIKARLFWSFILFMLLFAGFGIFSIIEMDKLGDLTSTLYDHPLQVSNAALRASLGIIKIHRSNKDMILAKSDFGIQKEILNIQDEEKIVRNNLDIIQKQILGEEGKRLADEAENMFLNWEPIINEVTELVKKGEDEAAAQISRGKGADYVFRLEKKMQQLRDYAANKADGFIENAREVQHEIHQHTLWIIIFVAIFSFLIALLIIRSTLTSISSLRDTMSEITRTGTFFKSNLAGNNEITEMASHFNILIEKLQEQFQLRDGLNRLNQELSGNMSYQDLIQKSIYFISKYTESCIGALYLYNKKNLSCELKGSYAFVERKYLSNQFKFGEGIIGQVAVEKKPILLKNITREEAVGTTGTMSEPPKNIYAMPLVYEDELYGVLEVASFEAIGDKKRELLDEMGKIISISLYTALQGEQIKELLESTQQANEELQARTDELNSANEKLTAMNQELQAQSQELKAQSEELKAQKSELEVQQLQVEEADRLKSEFLSNMSHELRTPLNSVMALSQLMISRGTGKNPEQEAEYLRVIERNGRRLLSLINDILDLSKIEAGRMDINLTEFNPRYVADQVIETVAPLAEEKSLKMLVDVEQEITMYADEDKVYQILLNLASNGVKFTDTGEVEIRIQQSGENVLFIVRDTGIGISETDMPYIFDEFRQVDGSTTRRYQGTGLGLAICQKLANLMQGKIIVISEKDKGSTFTLTLPLRVSEAHLETEDYQLTTDDDSHHSLSPITFAPSPITSDSSPLISDLSPRTSNLILVIDDDDEMCHLIQEYLTKDGYEVVTAHSGRKGLEIAQQIKPFAITLDLLMPEMDGWEVLRKLKESEETADIPVIIVSVSDDRETGMALGATGYVVKPVDRVMLLAELEKISKFKTVQRILVIDDDLFVLNYLEDLLGGKGYWVETASRGKAGIAQALANPPDVMILDLIMPEIDGFAVLEQIRREPAIQNMPVIILTAKDLTKAERERLSQSVHRIITKGEMDKEEILYKIEKALASLAGKEKAEKPVILVVEDNEVAMLQIRSILEENGYKVYSAFGGAEALECIRKEIPDAIILDLMMPDVDGFQVLEQIRSTARTAKLPVLVLTAKELTSKDRARLKNNNIQQLVQKGSVDQKQLLSCVAKLFPEKEERKVPLSSEKEERKVSLHSTILIVEDNPDNLFTITAILDDFNYSYITTDNGEDAIRITKKSMPGLILMDVQLPGVSGLDATKQIKADPSMANIPIVAVTARAMRGDKEKIIASGCDDYLSKPIDPSDLITMIKKYLP